MTLCSQTLGFAQEGTPLPKLSRFPLAPLVTEVGSEAAGLQSRAVAFNTRMAEGFEIYADREQMFRVLSNLVRNGYEAGAGTVTVTAAAEEAEAEAKAEGGSITIIEVTDDGPGLPPKVCENLFQPFAGSSRVGGTGLGLAIARDLLRSHGGDIELISTADEGTVFRLILPMDQHEVVGESS